MPLRNTQMLKFDCILVRSDPRAGPRIAGVHGPAGIRAQTGPDHHAQTGGHPGGAQETNEGIEIKP